MTEGNLARPVPEVLTIFIIHKKLLTLKYSVLLVKLQ